MQKIVGTKPAAGLGAMLLSKLSGATFAKAASTTSKAVTVSKAPRPPAAAVNAAFRELQKRHGLFGPMFAITRAENSLAKADLPMPHGSRQDIEAPGRPGTPMGMTTPNVVTRRPAQQDPAEASYQDAMRASYAAGMALFGSIKEIHRLGKPQPNNYAVAARRLGVPSPAAPYQTTGRSTLPELNTETLMVGSLETAMTVLDPRRLNQSPNR
jgi:hypothetical protein